MLNQVQSAELGDSLKSTPWQAKSSILSINEGYPAYLKIRTGLSYIGGTKVFNAWKAEQV